MSEKSTPGVEDVSSLKVQIEQLQRQLKESETEKEALRHELRVEHSQYVNTVRSFSYRAGRVVTLPLRVAKKTLQKAKHVHHGWRQERRILGRITQVYGINDENSDQKIKLDIIIRSYYHPTSSTFIRLLSPLTFGSLGQKLHVKLVDGEKYTLRADADGVIVQRTALPDMAAAQRLVEEVRARKLPLFVDTDDAFGDLDKSHPQYSIQKERSDALRYVIERADEVWYSTENLSKLYENQSFKVVHNTLDGRVWPILGGRELAPFEKDAPLRMVYMGTMTHSEDFAMIIPVFERLYRQYEGKFELHVIGVAKGLGEYPWIITHKPESALYPDFTEWFSSALPRFDLGLSPLVDNSFNRAKSDIKCLDYMASGVIPMVSNVAAYQNPALNELILRVENTDDAWFTAIEKEILSLPEQRTKREAVLSRALAYVNEERFVRVASKVLEESIVTATERRAV